MFRRWPAGVLRATTASMFKRAADAVDDASAPTPRPRSLRRERKSAFLSDAEKIADRVKSMSDAEWEATPVRDKVAFNTYIARQLKSAPSTVSEQQRRRYYETTMQDPEREEPGRTVLDATERLRLGLPAKVVTDRRRLGVSEAMYERGDAALFDPQQARNIESAMTELKQMFVDYVDKKKAGLSTEAQRRALAKASEELNYQTQLHLAHMFKYAEAKVQEVILEERQKQLQRLAVVRAALRRRKARRGTSMPQTAENSQAPASAAVTDEATAKISADGDRADDVAGEEGQQQRARSGKRGGKLSAKRLRTEHIKRVLRDTYGLDVDTAKAVSDQIQAQEKFLRLCEVMARMTVGRGFKHTAEDENLDAYTATLRDVYSCNPERLCRVDAVQYLAATEGVAPIDWATRWYQKLLLVPLQATPEYRAVQQIQREEEEIAKAAGIDPSSGSSNASGGQFAKRAAQEATSLVEKMFLPPDDARLSEMHEKRLRYIAHVQMESQIKRLRDNARIFEGAEDTEAAERCSEIYAKIVARRASLRASAAANTDASSAPTSDGAAPEPPGQADVTAASSQGEASNDFERDPELRAWFEEIRDICEAFIEQRVQENATAKKARRAAALADALALGRPETVAAELRQRRREHKKEQVGRMLRILERDVREDMVWVRNMQEAERPAPLPIPEPMSYVGAADVLHWKALRTADEAEKGNPFSKKPPSGFRPTFLGQPWQIPDKPMLFWGTGASAVAQALKHAAEDAQARTGKRARLPPPFPCAENPWGWRLKADVLDELDEAADDDAAASGSP